MVGVICVQYTVGACTCMCIAEAFSVGPLVAETMGHSGFLGGKISFVSLLCLIVSVGNRGLW